MNNEDGILLDERIEMMNIEYEIDEEVKKMKNAIEFELIRMN